MKIRFISSIKEYQDHHFPTNIQFVPRIGEKVLVNEKYVSHFLNQNLPLSLEVCDVIYSEESITCFLKHSKFNEDFLKTT